MIGYTGRVHPKRSELVTPRYGGVLILERTDRLPAVKPRIANRHRRVLGATTEEAKTSHWHEATPAAGHFRYGEDRTLRKARDRLRSVPAFVVASQQSPDQAATVPAV
jgi:hypothetical protein